MKNSIELERIAKRITAQLKEQTCRLVDQHSIPDMGWSLEKAIIQALDFVQYKTEKRVRGEIEQIIRDFDNESGTTSS